MSRRPEQKAHGPFLRKPSPAESSPVRHCPSRAFGRSLLTVFFSARKPIHVSWNPRGNKRNMKKQRKNTGLGMMVALLNIVSLCHHCGWLKGTTTALQLGSSQCHGTQSQRECLLPQWKGLNNIQFEITSHKNTLSSITVGHCNHGVSQTTLLMAAALSTQLLRGVNTFAKHDKGHSPFHWSPAIGPPPAACWPKWQNLWRALLCWKRIIFCPA